MEASISNEVITKQNEVYHTYETIRTRPYVRVLYFHIYLISSTIRQVYLLIILLLIYLIIIINISIKIIMIFIRSYYILPSKVRTNERTNKVISSNNKIIHQEFIYYLRTFENLPSKVFTC